MAVAVVGYKLLVTAAIVVVVVNYDCHYNPFTSELSANFVPLQASWLHRLGHCEKSHQNRRRKLQVLREAGNSYNHLVMNAALET